MSRDCFLSQFWPAYALLNELELDKIPIPTFNQEPSLCAESVMAEFGLFVLFSREVQPVQSRISLSRASCTALYCIVLYCTALYCTVLGTVAAAASPFADRFAVGGTNVAACCPSRLFTCALSHQQHRSPRIEMVVCAPRRRIDKAFAPHPVQRLSRGR